LLTWQIFISQTGPGARSVVAMTYELALGDRAYSSWSLRAWLLFEVFGIPVTTRVAPLFSDAFDRLMAHFAPSRTVPALKLPDGTVMWDSLAISEELASRHPEAGLWPADPSARALARALSAEMHSGFPALRNECPMNLRIAYADFPVSTAVRADIDRIEALWRTAADRRVIGPWLCGRYSVVDVFFAPVAMRIAGYGIPVGPAAQEYVEMHLDHPALRRWRAMGLAGGPDQPVYTMPHEIRSWPGPVPRHSKVVASGPSENTACPYSGRPTTHFLDIDGRTIGFCNAFCRDKTAADPDAWPQLAPLLQGVC
jgi:glutathione S-transferase